MKPSLDMPPSNLSLTVQYDCAAMEIGDIKYVVGYKFEHQSNITRDELVKLLASRTPDELAKLIVDLMEVAEGC